MPAFAKLSAESVALVTVILDDALLNADDQRKERMQSILYAAGSRDRS